MEDKIKKAIAAGANRASVVETGDIVTDKAFRDICKTNACGAYGKCWMCPPDIGEIDELIERVTSYSHALVYQNVYKIEDSFDFEGMQAAKKDFNKVIKNIKEEFNDAGLLHLGAGGCGVCDSCAKREDKPCRFPEQAVASLEGYGINVSELAKVAGMKYINGENTVTYFGAVLFKEE